MPDATQSQLVSAGSSQISMLVDAPLGIAPHLTWRLINDADGTIVIPESSDQIVEIDPGFDSALRRYDRQYIAPSSVGRYLAIWRYQLQEIPQTIVVEPSADVAFASLADVGKRLGRSLSTDETNSGPFLLNMASAVIADAAGYDDGWAAALRPVPQLLRMLSVELVWRAIANPNGYTQVQQQVGAYGFQAAWDRVGMTLSEPEVLMIRRAVHGRTTGDVHVASSFEREQDEYWLRKESAEFGSAGDASNPNVIQ